MQEQPDTWLNAIRGLKDNPLVVYLRQAELRRLQRAGALRRSLFFILVLALAVLIVSLLGVNYAEENNGDIWGAFNDESFLLTTAAILILPAYMVWACQGLFQAVVDALLVLAPPSRRTHHLTVDDLGAITLLGDREIVAGALAILLPPLLVRQAVGAMLLCAGMLLFEYVSNGLGPGGNIYTALAFVPLTVAALVLSGTLALTALLLFLLALGRDMRPALASAGAMIMVVTQVLYGGVGFGLCMIPKRELGAIASGIQVLLLIVIALLVFWLLLYAAQAAQAYPVARYILAVGAPLLAVFIPAVLAIPIGIYTRFAEPFGTLFAHASVSYLADLGALSVLNPFAIPSPLCWGSPLKDVLEMPWPEWLRFPLLLALQLGLVAMFAHYALQAVRVRRQNG